MFVDYLLRTTDVAGAAAFYGALLGWTVRDGAFFAGDRRVGGLAPLPERARAMGAPSHWLGLVRVDDAAAAARRWIAAGGQPRGPVQAELAVLSDAQGAVFGLTSAATLSEAPPVWHQLHTTDADAAAAAYAALCGWTPAAGGIADTARRPGVHTHWMFHFAVADLAAAAAQARALGATVLPEQALPDGARMCACDDPQGAAFALHR